MEKSIYAIKVEPMEADESTSDTLAPHRGKVLLIVNTASQCGFTPQYKGLQELHKRYNDAGLLVLGFPSNDFGGQEPGTETEIVEFCTKNFDVGFPLYAKVHAKGEEIAPLYRYLTEGPTPETGEVKWNFEKFLVGRDGTIVGRYRSQVAPDDPLLIAAIERELAKDGAEE